MQENVDGSVLFSFRLRIRLINYQRGIATRAFHNIYYFSAIVLIILKLFTNFRAAQQLKLENVVLTVKRDPLV